MSCSQCCGNIHSAQIKMSLEGAEQKTIPQSLGAGSKLAIDFIFLPKFWWDKKKNKKDDAVDF